MGAIRTAARSAFRDFATAGVPASGVHEPIKSEIVGQAFGAVEDVTDALATAIGALQTGQAGAGIVFPTKAALDAVLTHPANTKAEVYADGTEANNGVYQKVGASGAGSWTKISDLATTAIAASVAEIIPRVQGGGNLISYARTFASYGGGAVAASGTSWGVTVPAGQTGNFSTLIARQSVDGAALVGRKEKFTFVSEAASGGASFSRDVYPRVIVYSAAVPLGEFRTGNYTPGSPPSALGQRIDTVEYEYQGDETQIDAVLLFNDGTTAPNDETLIPIFYGRSFTDAPDLTPAESLGDLVIEDRLGRFAGRIGALGGYGKYARIVTVKASGGDFTSIKAANDAISGASPTQRVKIEVYPGVAAPTEEVVTKDWVDYIGVGQFWEVVQSLALPNGATLEEVRDTSTFWLLSNSSIENMTLEITNGRYVVHWETSAARPFTKSAIRNCLIRHKGNAASINGTWPVTSQMAIGAGNSDGEEQIIEGCICIGPGGGFSYHTPNVTSRTTNATRVIARNNTFIASDPTGHPFKIVPITVGGGDICQLEGNAFSGGPAGILYDILSQWVSTDVVSSRAQIQVIGHGNKGASCSVAFSAGIAGSLAGSLFRPFFADEETQGWNDTGSFIPRKTVLAWADDGRLKVRPMTSSDNKALFAGVAMGDIADDALGRVKTGGLLLVTDDVLTTGGGTPAIGSTYSLSATAGTLQLGGSQGLLEVASVVSGVVTVRVA